MEPVSRRSFIKRAGTVAAVAGTAALAPAGIASAAKAVGRPTTAESLGALSHEPIEELGTDNEAIVARVLSGGEIQVFVGDREFTLVDRSVASRIIRATR